MSLEFNAGDMLILSYEEDEVEGILRKLGYSIDEAGYVVDKNGNKLKSKDDPSKIIHVHDILVIAPGSEAQIITSDEEYNAYLFDKIGV